jgi:hypothetical protein
MLYELLSRKLPFPQSEMTGLIGAIVLTNPEPLPKSVPPDLSQVVAKALEKNPVNRYDQVIEMREDLHVCLALLLQRPIDFEPSTRPARPVDKMQSPREERRSEIMTVQRPQNPLSNVPRALPIANSIAQRAQPIRSKEASSSERYPWRAFGLTLGMAAIAILTVLLIRPVGSGFSAIGTIVLLAGWVWLIVVAARTAGAAWAVIVFLFSWLGGLIFCIVKKTGWAQWGLMLIGFILVVVGTAMSDGMSYNLGTTP